MRKRTAPQLIDLSESDLTERVAYESPIELEMDWSPHHGAEHGPAGPRLQGCICGWGRPVAGQGDGLWSPVAGEVLNSHLLAEMLYNAIIDAREQR